MLFSDFAQLFLLRALEFNNPFGRVDKFISIKILFVKRRVEITKSFLKMKKKSLVIPLLIIVYERKKKKHKTMIWTWIDTLTLLGLSSQIYIRPGGGGNIAPLGFILF